LELKCAESYLQRTDSKVEEILHVSVVTHLGVALLDV